MFQSLDWSEIFDPGTYTIETIDDDKNERKNTKARKRNKLKEKDKGKGNGKGKIKYEDIYQVEELSRREQLLYRHFQTFFLTSDIPKTWIDPMISKQEEINNMYSGRLLDYFMTNYVKDHVARYFLLFDPTDIINDNHIGVLPSHYCNTWQELCELARERNVDMGQYNTWMEIDLQSEYSTMIRRHRKLHFDLFRRGKKFHFYYELPMDNNSTQEQEQEQHLVSTFCQLTFFWWAACIQLHRYWKQHYQDVRKCERSNNTNARKKQAILFDRAYTLKQLMPPIKVYPGIPYDQVSPPLQINMPIIRVDRQHVIYPHTNQFP